MFHFCHKKPWNCNFGIPLLICIIFFVKDMLFYWGLKIKLDWYISNNNFVSHINHIIWIKEPLPLLISKTFDYDYELHESPNTKIPKLQSQDVYKDDSMYDNDYNNIILW